MPGVQRDRKRKVEPATVDLITPHGSEITVTKARADVLLARAPLPFGDNTFRKYVLAGEDNVVSTVEARTAARAPRRGNNESVIGDTGGGEK